MTASLGWFQAKSMIALYRKLFKMDYFLVLTHMPSAESVYIYCLVYLYIVHTKISYTVDSEICTLQHYWVFLKEPGPIASNFFKTF